MTLAIISFAICLICFGLTCAFAYRTRRYYLALVAIRNNEGHVCRAYDLCSPTECVAPDCQPWVANNSSVAAWFTADNALEK